MYSAQEDGVVRKVKEFETQTRVFFNLLPPMVKIDNYSSSSMSILSERNAKEALNKVDFWTAESGKFLPSPMIFQVIRPIAEKQIGTSKYELAFMKCNYSFDSKTGEIMGTRCDNKEYSNSNKEIPYVAYYLDNENGTWSENWKIKITSVKHDSITGFPYPVFSIKDSIWWRDLSDILEKDKFIRSADNIWTDIAPNFPQFFLLNVEDFFWVPKSGIIISDENEFVRRIGRYIQAKNDPNYGNKTLFDSSNATDIFFDKWRLIVIRFGFKAFESGIESSIIIKSDE